VVAGDAVVAAEVAVAGATDVASAAGAPAGGTVMIRVFFLDLFHQLSLFSLPVSAAGADEGAGATAGAIAD
jgi:hypothetical protein